MIPAVRAEHLEHALSKAGIDFDPKRLQNQFYIASVASSLVRRLHLDPSEAIAVVQRAVAFLVFVHANRAALEARELIHGPLTGFDVDPLCIVACARVRVRAEGLRLDEVLTFLDHLKTS